MYHYDHQITEWMQQRKDDKDPERLCGVGQMDYLDADSFDGQQEGIEWMKAGDLHELLLLLVRYARLDSLQQGVGLQGWEEYADTDIFKFFSCPMRHSIAGI